MAFLRLAGGLTLRIGCYRVRGEHLLMGFICLPPLCLLPSSVFHAYLLLSPCGARHCMKKPPVRMA